MFFSELWLLQDMIKPGNGNGSHHQVDAEQSEVGSGEDVRIRLSDH